jgi:hypothetical protein
MITGCSEITSMPYFVFKDSVSMLKTAEVFTGFWWGNLRERNHFENQGIDGGIILKGIFSKWDGALTGLISFRMGQASGCCECGDEPSGSKKIGGIS